MPSEQQATQPSDPDQPQERRDLPRPQDRPQPKR